MDERRDGPGGATGARDCPPASLWVDAVAWLGNLMYQEVMGEPYEDSAAFLAESPCDEFWVISHDFDRAVTTLVVDLVVGDPDSVKMARDYMDGLEPPAWSRCAKFLETGLEEGDFHDVGVEVDPSVRVSLQRLIDDTPDCPGERWAELPEASIEGRGPDDPLRIEMAHWFEWLGSPKGLGDAIRYMEVNPPGHLWALGWEFDRALLHRLAVEMVFCEEPGELAGLSAALRMPDDAKDASLVERLRLGRLRFLGECDGAPQLDLAWFTWEGGLWDADDADDMIRHLVLGGPDRSWWEMEGFDLTVVHALQAKGVKVAPVGKLGRLLELIGPPRGSETRRWLEALIGERQRERSRKIPPCVLVCIALLVAVGSFAARSAQHERAREIQEDLEEMQLHREEPDTASDDEDGPELDLDPGAQDAADRLYDMLDPEYVATAE